MSVPKSKVLSVSKGVMALADLKHSSPDIKQHVIVNVGSNSPPHEEKVTTRNIPENDLSDIVVVQPDIPTPTNPNTNVHDVKVSYPDNPYANVIDLQALITQKDNVAKALSIMLELVENNPLIINKLIIAPPDTLAELIKLLASADDVKISYMLNEDVGCTCGSVKWTPVDKIYVVKNGQTQVLKYAYPDVIQLLDQHRISYKLVINS